MVRPESQRAESIALRVANLLSSRGYQPCVDVETASSYPSLRSLGAFKLEEAPPPSKVIVIGGDGTLLRASVRGGDNDVLFLAVRAGKRGFLMDVDESVLDKRLQQFLEGDYELVLHSRLRAELHGKKLPCALNDVVFFTSEGSMVKMEVLLNSGRVMSIDGDGLVISTTTGSTAYSLNAGGPIIDPRLDVIVLTPLNAVQLFLRSVVLPLSSKLRVRLRDDSGPAYLVIDGQVKYRVEGGDEVSVYPCEKPLKVARFGWWDDYYERLFERLFSYW